MPAARLPGTYTRPDGRGAMAELVHRSLRSDLDAVRMLRADAINASISNQPGRFEFPSCRRHPGALPRDAGGRPRISLSLHQRSALGHHHDRADRAGHRASQRDLRRQAAERGRAESWCSTPATCSRSTNSRATTAWKAAAAPMSASRDHAVRPRRQRQCAVRTIYQLFGLNSYAVADMTNTGLEVRPAEHPVRLRRPRQLFAEPDLYVQRALARG